MAPVKFFISSIVLLIGYYYKSDTWTNDLHSVDFRPLIYFNYTYQVIIILIFIVLQILFFGSGSASIRLRGYWQMLTTTSILRELQPAKYNTEFPDDLFKTNPPAPYNYGQLAINGPHILTKRVRSWDSESKKYVVIKVLEQYQVFIDFFSAGQKIFVLVAFAFNTIIIIFRFALIVASIVYLFIYIDSPYFGNNLFSFTDAIWTEPSTSDIRYMNDLVKNTGNFKDHLEHIVSKLFDIELKSKIEIVKPYSK